MLQCQKSKKSRRAAGPGRGAGSDPAVAGDELDAVGRRHLVHLPELHALHHERPDVVAEPVRLQVLRLTIARITNEDITQPTVACVRP